MWDSRSGLPDSIAESTILSVASSCSSWTCSGRGSGFRIESSTRWMRLATISMSASTRSSSKERNWAAGSLPSKAATTNTRQLASRIIAIRRRVALVAAAQSGRIDQFQRGLCDLLGVIDLAELCDARVGNGGHGALPGMGQRRVGRHTRQPVEEGVFPDP